MVWEEAPHLCCIVCDSIGSDRREWASAGKENGARTAAECLLKCALGFGGWIGQRKYDGSLIDA